MVIVRLSVTRKEADESALALASSGIPSSVDQTTDGWALVVSTSDVQRATQLLATYERENQPLPPIGTESPDHGPTTVAVVASVVLVAFYWLTGPRANGSLWFSRGSASASLILAGEIWRCLTALTLHANLAHVLGNAAALSVFGTAVCRSFGAGLGLCLILLAGAGGNLLNAILRGSHHSSVGASTAVFGTLGILGALQAIRRRRGRSSSWRTWTPVAAAMGLLAFLGTGAESDVLAHLFGFFVGLLLGGATTLMFPERPPSRSSERPLLAAAVLTVVAAWCSALVA